jgi:hypothetical protein
MGIAENVKAVLVAGVSMLMVADAIPLVVLACDLLYGIGRKLWQPAKAT